MKAWNMLCCDGGRLKKENNLFKVVGFCKICLMNKKLVVGIVHCFLLLLGACSYNVITT